MIITHNSVIPRDWKYGYLGTLLKDIKELLYDKLFPGKNYIIGKHNLLKNTGVIANDQPPHTDYPQRLNY